MPRASIPVVLKVLAENDPSVKAQLEALERQLDDFGKKGSSNLKKPFEDLEKATESAGKRIKDVLSKEVAAGAQDVVKGFQDSSKAAAAASAASIREAKKMAKGLADAEQGANAAGEGAVGNFAGRVRRRTAEVRQSVQQQVGSLQDTLTNSLSRVSSSLRSKLGVGGGLLGEMERLGRGLKFKEIDLSSLGVTKDALAKRFGVAAEDAEKRLGQLQQIIAGVATGGVAAMAALSAAIIGTGAAAISVAARFELFQVKLETALKSSAKAAHAVNDAVRLAAKTPFNVEGLVDAAVKLEVYGVRSKEVLPLVADLAAGMGQRIEDTALVIGKAMSGSLEGFKSLRNEFGISTARLVKFGAVADSTGRLIVRGTDNLEKARKALTTIIATDFAGAVDKQSKTLVGALSNLEDAVINIAREFGAPFLGSLSKAVRGFTLFLEVAAATPPALREFITIGLGVTGMLSGMGATLGVVSLAALGAALALKKVAEAEAVRGIAGLSSALTGTAEKLSKLGAMAAGPMLLSGAFWGVAAAVVGVGAALKTLADAEISHQLELGDAIKGQADAMNLAASAVRTYRAALAGAGVEASKLTGLLTDALKEADKFKFFSSLRQRGLDLDELRKQEKDLGTQSAPVLAQAAAVKAAGGGAGGKLSFEGLSGAQQQAIRDFLQANQLDAQEITKRVPIAGDIPGRMTFEQVVTGVQVDPAKLAEQLHLLEGQRKELEQGQAVLKSAIQTWEQFGVQLDRVNESAKQFDTFFQVATRDKDDVLALNVALGETKNRLASIQAAAKAQGIANLTKGEILRRLSDPRTAKDEAAVKFFEEYVQTLNRVVEIRDILSKREKQQVQERVNQLKFAADFENSLREGSIRKEEDELKDRRRLLDTQLDQVKGYAAKRIKLEQDLQRVLAQINFVGPTKLTEAQKFKLQAEAEGIRRELGNIGELANLEVSTRGELVQNRTAQLKLRASTAGEALQKTVEQASQAAKDAAAAENIGGAKDKIQTAIDAVEALKKKYSGVPDPTAKRKRPAAAGGPTLDEMLANDAAGSDPAFRVKKADSLLGQSPELRRAFESATNRLKNERRALVSGAQEQRFKQVQEDIKNAVAAADTPMQRLAALERGRLTINEGIAKNLFKQSDTAAELTRIATEEATIRRQSLKEREKVEKQIREGHVAEAEQRIELLKSLTDEQSRQLGIMGQMEDKERLLKELERQRIRGRLEAMRATAVEEIRQHNNAAQVQQRFMQQALAFVRGEMAKLAQKSPAQQALDDRNQRKMDAKRKSRIGGVHSPLYSDSGEDEDEDVNETSGVEFSGVKATRPFGGRDSKGNKVAWQRAAGESLLNKQATVERDLMNELTGYAKQMADALAKGIEVKGRVDMNIKVDVEGNLQDFQVAGEGIGEIYRTTVNGMFSDHNIEGRRANPTRGGKHGR